MRRLAFSLLTLLALAPAAAAQFAQFDWTLENPFNFLAWLNANSMQFGGGSGGIPVGATVQYSAVAHVDGLVIAKGTAIATPKGDCGDSHGFWGVAGDLHILGDCTSAAPFAFNVHAGETMIFGMQVDDSTLPGDVTYFGFNFRPFWKVHGGALAGASGPPALEASGVLAIGEAVNLTIADAAPAAATTLVLGLSQANLPFKGGVLVPTPTVLIAGLATDATGGLELVGHWPAGLPTAFTFLAQAWIVDAGGPHGFAATNAVQGYAY